ncbi:alpha/beta fold hydrolase [Shewanella sp. AS16]|uniref:alpha/beta fold hydrolase n=1 Tax=Shewanella sp. AS16 TaxID=2907625 RepID=UPI001F1E8A2B|nr:alpha/beta fold hydrolase [Shewanella sp. AS16]MCE9687382.1 alpha/beta fold hydrolase [Shewanella sp. AS16]
MHYVSSGQGSAVVLIHGLFGNLDNLKALGQVLEQHHRVIRVDVPNHGLSEHWQQMDYPRLATAMTALLDALDLPRAHLVGHSMGGKIAMATALAAPERVGSLVVADIAPVAYSPRHDTVFDGLCSLPLQGHSDRRFALNHLLSAGIDEATAQFLLKNLQRTDTGFSWKMNLAGLKANYPELIGWHNSDSSYSGPSLFVRGGDSDYVTAAHRETILAQFPRVQAKTIEGTGHWLHAQKPAIFNRIVSEFIDKQEV